MPPDSEREPYLRAEALLAQGRAREAWTLLMSVSSPSDAARHDEALAEALVRDLRYDAAAQAADRALRSGRDTPKLRNVKAEALRHAGSLKASEAQARLAGDDDPDAVWYAARVAHRRGGFREAESLSKRTLELHPGFVNAENLLLASKAALGDVAAGETLRLRWADDRDLNALLYLLLGADASGRHDLEGSLPEALRHPGLDVNLLGHVAEYLVRQGRPEDALAALDKAPASLRDHPRIDSAYGTAYAARRDWRRALPHLERAFRWEPSGAIEASRYASALVRSGHLRRALGVMAGFLRAGKDRHGPPTS